ncbi:MAG: cytochrome C oxidase subunit IV family protein [Chloroflexi bacterium]|nr:cytochrome C oxidase subunit IV family protein [Chloroflexota bacterium]
MDQTGLLIVMWIASGAFLGGVLTPVLTAGRRLNEWAAMAIGLVTGAVGNLLLLVPLWLGLSRVAPAEETHEPAWKRDAVTLDDLLAAEAAGTGGVLPPNPLPALKRNFWPVPREDGEHSHRMTYVGVFVALAVVTAIEVALSVLDSSADLGFSVVWPLAALSTLKILLVVAYFMHLRWENRWFILIFAGSVPFALMVLVVLGAVA